MATDGVPLKPGFLAELRRRRVLRVVGFYAITVWLIVQAGQILAETFSLPSWVMITVIVVVTAGFPIVAGLAWVFDLTPYGIVRTGPREDGQVYEDELGVVTEHPRLWIDVSIILVLLAMIAYLLIEPGPADDAAPAQRTASIAVLPFINLSTNPDDAYLGDALAEDIIHHLTQITGLKVAARTSSWAWRDRRAEIPRIAEALQVESVLEGSIQREQDTLRITLQLIRGSDGHHLWSRTYRRGFSNLFAIKDAVAMDTAASLGLDDTENLRIGSSEVDSRAYELYLRGREYLQRPRTAQAVELAVQMFGDAVGIAPRFAGAHAGLCEAHLVRYAIGRESATFENAERACHRALTLDSSRIEAQLALGQLYRHSGQYDLASERFASVLRTRGDPDAILGLAAVAAARDRALEAEELFERALVLDPGYWRAYHEYGLFRYARAEYSRAAELFEWEARLTPDSAVGYNSLAAAQFMAGDFSSGLTSIGRSYEIAPTAHNAAAIGLYHWHIGEFALAERWYREALAGEPGIFHNWCRLGAAIRDSARVDEAAGAFRRGVELARERLAINPNDAETHRRLALCHMGLGQHEMAVDHVGTAQRLAPGSPVAEYYAAIVLLNAGETLAGFEHLERALAGGMSPAVVRSNPELARFHEMARFNELVASPLVQNSDG